MLVYRCLSQYEIENIEKNKFGSKNPTRGTNTHKYIPGKNYFHFFKFSQSAEFYFKENAMGIDEENEFKAYMIADIPEDILKRSLGYGFYSYVNNQYVVSTILFPEYAIDIELFKPEYIVEISKTIKNDYSSNTAQYNNYLKLFNHLEYSFLNTHQSVAYFLIKSDLDELIISGDIPKQLRKY